MMNYGDFISNKTQIDGMHGFEPTFLHDGMFDFQRQLVEWSTRKGRSAIFADCGLGKTVMQLVWAKNVVDHTNGKVLILTPLAVGSQTKHEGEKFGIDCCHSRDGTFNENIVITNYEQLGKFSPDDFDGAVCDESSILKNFKGKTKTAITDFMRKMKYRLLCTATAAPNDVVELGTSSEALGYLGHIDMLQKFFKSDNNSYAQGGGAQGATRFKNDFGGGKFRFRGHAERDFWRWVCSWARAIRKPSDMGCDDSGFDLPELNTVQHTVEAKVKQQGRLFDVYAVTLAEQREERRRTLNERCEKAAEITNAHNEPCVCWCHLNDEGNTLTKMIDGAVQISGSDTDKKKCDTFDAFVRGDIRVLVTKSKIAGFGLNWQHCNRQTFFPSHSFEQWYQAIRRSWRFGQKRDVRVDVITSEGENRVLKNLQRKAGAAEKMFAELVEMMHNELNLTRGEDFTKKEEIPQWL